jgi:prevent-host-death family protein
MNTSNATNLVSLKELREQFPKYIEAVSKGRSFMVVKRSKPIFKITPIGEDEVWEAVVDFTQIKKGGVDINELLSRIQVIKQQQ